MNRSEVYRWRASMRAHIAQLEPNYIITFNFGYEAQPITAQCQMTTFFNALQRHVYGRDWAKQRGRKWPVAYGFLEHRDTNLHYHVLARLDDTTGYFAVRNGPALWTARVPRGQLDVREIYHLEGIVSYCTKELISPAAVEEVFIYSDTRPKH